MMLQASVVVNDTSSCPFASGFKCDLKKGSTIWLHGPSGTGKTSIAEKIIEASHTGQSHSKLGFSVHLTRHENLKIHILSQEATLLDSLTVEENLKLSLELVGASTAKMVISKYMEIAGVGSGEKFLSKYPSQLSLGLRRRVALSVILCQNPQVLVLDEPFASLDDAAARSISESIKSLQSKTGLCIFIISHLAEFTNLLEPTDTLQLQTNHQFFGDHKLTPSYIRFFISMFHARGGLSFLQRIWSDFFQLVAFSAPMCFLAGFLVGNGFLGMLNKILRFVNTATLLQILPSSILDNPLFSLVRDTVEGAGEEMVSEKKPKIIGVALAYVSIEVVPLLVGLMMAGIIGSSFGGRIATLQATNQESLLSNLGMHRTWVWTFPSSVLAVTFAAPLLSALCSYGLWTGVASLDEDHAGKHEIIWKHIIEGFWDHNFNGGYRIDTNGLATYPPFIMLYRTIGFMIVVVAAAEFTTRKLSPSLSAKDVSFAIALSVVLSYIAVFIAEFLFSKIMIASINTVGILKDVV